MSNKVIVLRFKNLLPSTYNIYKSNYKNIRTVWGTRKLLCVRVLPKRNQIGVLKLLFNIHFDFKFIILSIFTNNGVFIYKSF